MTTDNHFRRILGRVDEVVDIGHVAMVGPIEGALVESGLVDQCFATVRQGRLVAVVVVRDKLNVAPLALKRKLAQSAARRYRSRFVFLY